LREICDQASDGGSTTASTSGAVVPRKSVDTFPPSGVPLLSNGPMGLGGSLSPVPCPPANSGPAPPAPSPAPAALPPPSLPPPYSTAPLQVRYFAHACIISSKTNKFEDKRIENETSKMTVLFVKMVLNTIFYCLTRNTAQFGHSQAFTIFNGFIIFKLQNVQSVVYKQQFFLKMQTTTSQKGEKKGQLFKHSLLFPFKSLLLTYNEPQKHLFNEMCSFTPSIIRTNNINNKEFINKNTFLILYGHNKDN
jgi:hypothetical protein